MPTLDAFASREDAWLPLQDQRSPVDGIRKSNTTLVLLRSDEIWSGVGRHLGGCRLTRLKETAARVLLTDCFLLQSAFAVDSVCLAEAPGIESSYYEPEKSFNRNGLSDQLETILKSTNRAREARRCRPSAGRGVPECQNLRNATFNFLNWLFLHALTIWLFSLWLSFTSW